MAQAKVFNEQEFSHQLRPAFTPVNITLMILFFVVGLWPFGLLAIAYMLYGKEVGIDFSNWGSAKRSMARATDRAKDFASRREEATGNEAFDDWRREELARLDEERRRLDEARKEFDEYVRELRRARDRDEFEAFRRQWNGKGSGDEDTRESGDTPAA